MTIGKTFRSIRRKVQQSPYLFWSVLLVLSVSAGTLLYVLTNAFEARISSSVGDEMGVLDHFPIPEPTLRYGFVMEKHHVIESRIEAGQTLADILLPHGIDFLTIEQIATKAKQDSIFDVRKLRPGFPYLILKPDADTSSRATHFIFEPSIFYHVVFDLTDSLHAFKEEKPVEIVERQSAGVVYSSLWNAMTGNGMDFALAAKMEDALAWSVDFHHIQPEAAFRLLYNEKQIEGDAAGIGDLHAAWFRNGGQTFYAFYYDSGKYKGFYDIEGRPMKKAFLKAPVKYTRISSRYNPRRFHPVLKRVKAHLGTDYAAPYGTPIYATADGVVSRAGYTRGNGNFVKIKHDDVYSTQYLHMQRRAAGMRPGVSVRQGQVIGYVGATGLATGPHVCYRFWKNGKQVDPLRQNLPAPEPMPESELPSFFKVRDQLKAQLDQIPLPEPQTTSEVTPVDSIQMDKS